MFFSLGQGTWIWDLCEFGELFVCVGGRGSWNGRPDMPIWLDPGKEIKWIFFIKHNSSLKFRYVFHCMFSVLCVRLL